MIILTLCEDHGLREWRDVKRFDYFKQSMDSFGGCTLKYFLLEGGNIPDDYDSAQYNESSKTLDFYRDETLISYEPAKLTPWYEIPTEDLSEVYTQSQLDDIAIAINYPNYISLEKGIDTAPVDYPKISVANYAKKIYTETSNKFANIKVRAL
jgi:hypothetical protein